MTTQSRKDLFQAHRLMTQRAALALLRGEPDLPDQPMRRLNVAAFASVLTAVIVASLVVIMAILGHGGGGPSFGPGSLLIDRQTGTAYVFCEKGGKALCPVTNYASARLAIGAANPDQQTVNQTSLTHYPGGPLIGIPGLPQPLPEPSLLVRQPWSVCERTVISGVGQRMVSVLADGIRTGGHPLDRGALLVAAAGRDWLVWDGQRLAVPATGLVALNVRQQPIPVSPVLLNALPQGPDLVPPTIKDIGRQVLSGPAGPATVGQLYVVPGVGTPTQYYVMLTGGLARITQIQEALLAAQPNALPPRRLQLSQVAGHLSAARLSARGLPGHIPVFPQVSASAAICAVYSLVSRGGRTTAQVMLGGQLPSGGLPVTGTGISRIVLPPGAGALVGAIPGGLGHQGSAVSYFLVVGDHRYGLASARVAATLGYQLAGKAVLLSASVVNLIPAGPSLNPAAAKRTVAAGG